MAFDFTVHRLGSADVSTMNALLTAFGQAFDEAGTYGDNRPDDLYMQQLLGGDQFIALAATTAGQVIGGLAAYELRKFEQPRSEIYIYDLAVAMEHRRRGVATALIHGLKEIAASRGAPGGRQHPGPPRPDRRRRPAAGEAGVIAPVRGRRQER